MLQRTAAAVPSGRPPVKVTLAPEVTRSDKAAVLAGYADIDPSAADPDKGKAVFAAHCATCHRFEGAGVAVGPDLAALTDHSTGALLTAILDPNAALEDKYAIHVASGEAGAVGSGLLAEETATSVTLLAAAGVRQTLLRADLAKLENTHRSLMTEGLEAVTPPRCDGRPDRLLAEVANLGRHC